MNGTAIMKRTIAAIDRNSARINHDPHYTQRRYMPKDKNAATVKVAELGARKSGNHQE
jgi:hypothetical protein